MPTKPLTEVRQPYGRQPSRGGQTYAGTARVAGMAGPPAGASAASASLACCMRQSGRQQSSALLLGLLFWLSPCAFCTAGAAGWLKSTLAAPGVAVKYSGVLNGIGEQGSGAGKQWVWQAVGLATSCVHAADARAAGLH